MLSAPIAQVASIAGTPVLASIFLAAIFATFGFATWCQKKNTQHSFVDHTPNFLTSLGILGALAGTLAGLINFDATSLSGIGPLMESLTASLVTGLAGFLLSMLFKLLTKLSVQTTSDDPMAHPDEVTVADLYAAMVQQTESVELLRKTIASDAQTNQAEQFLLWSQMNDSQQHVQTQFEQVLEALNQVSHELSNQRVDLLGDNIAQLNASVCELADLQQNCAQQLSDMRAQRKVLEQAGHSLVHIDKKIQSISAAVVQSVGDKLSKDYDQLARVITKTTRQPV